MRTYWYKSSRGFANEYMIGVASSHETAKNYAAEGFERISRDEAMRRMLYQGDNATKAFVAVELDGERVDDRTSFARSLR